MSPIEIQVLRALASMPFLNALELGFTPVYGGCGWPVLLRSGVQIRQGEVATRVGRSVSALP